MKTQLELLEEYEAATGSRVADIPDEVASWLHNNGKWDEVFERAIQRKTPITEADTDGDLGGIPEGAVR